MADLDLDLDTDFDLKDSDELQQAPAADAKTANSAAAAASTSSLSAPIEQSTASATTSASATVLDSTVSSSRRASQRRSITHPLTSTDTILAAQSSTNPSSDRNETNLLLPPTSNVEPTPESQVAPDSEKPSEGATDRSNLDESSEPVASSSKSTSEHVNTDDESKHKSEEEGEDEKSEEKDQVKNETGNSGDDNQTQRDEDVEEDEDAFPFKRPSEVPAASSTESTEEQQIILHNSENNSNNNDAASNAQALAAPASPRRHGHMYNHVVLFGRGRQALQKLRTTRLNEIEAKYEEAMYARDLLRQNEIALEKRRKLEAQAERETKEAFRKRTLMARRIIDAERKMKAIKHTNDVVSVAQAAEQQERDAAEAKKKRRNDDDRKEIIRRNEKKTENLLLRHREIEAKWSLDSSEAVERLTSQMTEVQKRTRRMHKQEENNSTVNEWIKQVEKLQLTDPYIKQQALGFSLHHNSVTPHPPRPHPPAAQSGTTKGNQSARSSAQDEKEREKEKERSLRMIPTYAQQPLQPRRGYGGSATTARLPKLPRHNKSPQRLPNVINSFEGSLVRDPSPASLYDDGRAQPTASRSSSGYGPRGEYNPHSPSAKYALMPRKNSSATGGRARSNSPGKRGAGDNGSPHRSQSAEHGRTRSYVELMQSRNAVLEMENLNQHLLSQAASEREREALLISFWPSSTRALQLLEPSALKSQNAHSFPNKHDSDNVTDPFPMLPPPALSSHSKPADEEKGDEREGKEDNDEPKSGEEKKKSAEDIRAEVMKTLEQQFLSLFSLPTSSTSGGSAPSSASATPLPPPTPQPGSKWSFADLMKPKTSKKQKPAKTGHTSVFSSPQMGASGSDASELVSLVLEEEESDAKEEDIVAQKPSEEASDASE